MKLLLYSWKSNSEQILSDNLRKLGFEIIPFSKKCSHYTRDMELAAQMIPYIYEQGIEAVISFDYFPIISMICDTVEIPYYAWVYDCPHFTLYAKLVMLPCNHIGIFDRKLVENLQQYGVQTVYHVPLAVDADVFADAIRQASNTERTKYQCDISFIGSLYTDEHNYYDKLFPQGEENVWSQALQKQCFSYQGDYLREAVEQNRTEFNVLSEMLEEQGFGLGEDYFAKPEDVVLAKILEKKVTVEERRELLVQTASAFGEQYRFSLYTASDLQGIPLLSRHHKGTVDYHTQMPLVFAESRINLNLTLRSIHSGIPLRVLDCMACGGFMLTNWQPEIAEAFREGEEIATFRSLQECLDKISYYLQHEEERQRIAAAGQKKVQESFSYQRGFERLFEV
ncbi:MAG: glycosyltransferase [Clostridium sp.]|nr:glycosyltransferase [Clostridium sp.]